MSAVDVCGELYIAGVHLGLANALKHLFNTGIALEFGVSRWQLTYDIFLKLANLIPSLFNWVQIDAAESEAPGNQPVMHPHLFLEMSQPAQFSLKRIIGLNHPRSFH